MNQQQYIIKRKASLMELGEALGNISEACRKLGVSRQHYYDVKAILKEEGLAGLMEKSRRTPRLKNRVNESIEARILDYALQFPTQGQVRVSNELKKEGIEISGAGVRGVWLRHGITTVKTRLLRLEKWAAETKGILTESQVQALEEARLEKEAHGEIETFHPGYLLGQDSFYVGYIKGVGEIWQQTGIDTRANIGFAKVYSEKNAMVAADFLNDKVLPFYDQHKMSLLRVLTDRGSEYCGRPESHPFELYCHLNDIEHSKTKAKSPQTNGCTEKLNQTILEEFYKVAFRKKLYTSLEEIQTDLDAFMQWYNEERTNQGRHCQGRTPMQTFLDEKDLYQHYVNEGEKKLELAA
jgi:transposase